MWTLRTLLLVAATEFSKNGVRIETKSVAVLSHLIHSCTFVACSQTGIGAPRYHLCAPLYCET
jgi:hypothetical protein